ncbi:HET-domain-containing protein [Stipitochalara longipes BDJ]|nr:HET-domain-containing protein [Stipitochalara longipes BDJ]
MASPPQAFRAARVPQRAFGRADKDGLCDECLKLDLEESFVNAFALYEGARRGRNTRKLEVYRSDDDDSPTYLGHFYFVTSLGNRLSRPSLCRLCHFLNQTCPESSNLARQYETYKLLVICSSESYLFEVPKKANRKRLENRPWGALDHNVFMAVVPEVPMIPKTGVPLRWFETDLPKIGSIYRLTERSNDADYERYRIALPRLVGSKPDLSLPQLWLDCCQQSHKFCAPKKPLGASLPGFRVINCTKPRLGIGAEGFVVEDRPWSEKYVALSYVWGPPSGDWPKTVLDAVKVTKQLGEKYLWVDRLCINQANLEEKQFLISKMDAIYEGAEFTIIAAVGDARTGLTGISTTRKLQPLVDLKQRPRPAPYPDPSMKLLGVTTEELEKISQDREWLDIHRFGLKTTYQFSHEDIEEFKKKKEIMEIFGISSEHLTVFQDLADDMGSTIEEWMPKMMDQSEREGIPIQELAPHILRTIGTGIGMPEDVIRNLKRRPAPPVTPSSKIEKPLPPDQKPGTTILVSTMEDSRVAIRNSEWATRGWTYQEGVLSNRRLVFTEEQMYWECNGMATQESLDIIDLYDPTETRFADYMLSGIFDGDGHRVPELQYGFKASDVDEEVSEQVSRLDSHIRAFTSRNLSYDGDSLNAFLGVAARYSTNNGLSLVLGMPVWAALFATGKPGLQDTFALSISAWTHTATPIANEAEMYVVNCQRRPQFPSWTWIGWKGLAEFNATNAAGEDEDLSLRWKDDVHIEFFKAMTSKDWARGINGRLWSAEMMLHAADNSEATLLVGHAPIANTASDQSKKWLLTIRDPLVLRHMILMHSVVEGEWKRLMGKRVQIHLSVSMTEAELTAGHKTGEIVTILIFASRVPFVFNGTARYLILRRTDDTGAHWERIGRLAMTLEEWELDQYKSTAGMIAALPLKKFGRDMILI